MPSPVTNDGVVLEVLARSRFATDSDQDAVAFDLFTRAGWDPALYGLALSNNLSGVPATAESLARLKALIDKLPTRADEWRQPPVADARRFAGLKAEAATLAPTFLQTGQPTLIVQAMPNLFLSVEPPETAKARAQLQPPPQTAGNPWAKGPRPKSAP